jgi:hypothetical protein
MPAVSTGEPSHTFGRSRHRLNGNWTDHQLQATLKAVDQGLPVGTVASHFDIPRSTLRNHVTGVTGVTRGRNRGQAPVLTTEEEQQLVDYIIQM